jgi:hypothetical protein
MLSLASHYVCHIKNMFTYVATRMWNQRFVCDNLNHCAVGAGWKSVHYSPAVLAVWFVSHRTSSVQKVNFLKIEAVRLLNKVIVLNLFKQLLNKHTITETIRLHRLCWFRHVQRMEKKIPKEYYI